MKLFCVASFTAAMLTLASAWQQDPAAEHSRASNSSTESQLAGIEVVAELSHSVNVKKAKLGDIVKAAVTQDVLAHGKIVIRRGSKIVGHVTEIKLRTRDDQESRLGVIFDRALIKGGEEIDFSAAICALAVGVQMSSVDRPDEMPPPYIASTNSSNSMQPLGSSRRGVGSNTNTNTNTNGTTNQAGRISEIGAASTSGNNSSNSTNGVMGAGSRGVFGLPGLQLVAKKGPEHATIITSNSQNVKLDTGTQILIQVNNVVR